MLVWACRDYKKLHKRRLSTSICGNRRIFIAMKNIFYRDKSFPQSRIKVLRYRDKKNPAERKNQTSALTDSVCHLSIEVSNRKTIF